MKKLIGPSLRGFAAGTVGTVAMGGMSFLLRRMVEPNQPIGKTHYEKVVEWAAEKAGKEEEIDPASRVRQGEMLHLGFGALWGLVLALLLRRRQVRPLLHGSIFGATLWTGAFGGYLPALGISRSFREMNAYEFLRTVVCHLTYAVTTATFLKAFRPANSQQAPATCMTKPRKV